MSALVSSPGATHAATQRQGPHVCTTRRRCDNAQQKPIVTAAECARLRCATATGKRAAPPVPPAVLCPPPFLLELSGPLLLESSANFPGRASSTRLPWTASARHPWSRHATRQAHASGTPPRGHSCRPRPRARPSPPCPASLHAPLGDGAHLRRRVPQLVNQRVHATAWILDAPVSRGESGEELPHRS